MNNINTKKTIVINPELFTVSGSSKTRKNRASAAPKKQMQIAPAISTSRLQNKLLKRVSELRNKEIHNHSSMSKNPATKQVKNKNNIEQKEQHIYQEFDDSMSYINNLKQKQQQYLLKQKQQNRTLKQPVTANVFVDTSLPPDLAETMSSRICIPAPNADKITMNYTPIQAPPYGCLKGGIKPSFREWKAGAQTRKVPIANANNLIIDNDFSVRSPALSMPPELVQSITHDKTEREQRLVQIKDKLRNIDANIEPINTGTNADIAEIKHLTTQELLAAHDAHDAHKDAQNPINNFYKHTIRRKFTLGKCQKLKKIAVLINNNKTRKNIIATQKQLKKTNINDIRKILKKQGIIKVGSTCPNDILRKTFETSMMAGEITNTNKETLLHNFLSNS